MQEPNTGSGNYFDSLFESSNKNPLNGGGTYQDELFKSITDSSPADSLLGLESSGEEPSGLLGGEGAENQPGSDAFRSELPGNSGGVGIDREQPNVTTLKNQDIQGAGSRIEKSVQNDDRWAGTGGVLKVSGAQSWMTQPYKSKNASETPVKKEKPKILYTRNDTGEDRTPKVVTLDKVILGPNARWVDDNWRTRTVVIKTSMIEKAGSFFYVLIIMVIGLFFGGPVAIFNLRGFVNAVGMPVLAGFIATVLIILFVFFKLASSEKVWIEVHKDYFLIEKGYFRKKKNLAKFARNPQTFISMNCNVSGGRDSLYSTYSTGGDASGSGSYSVEIQEGKRCYVIKSGLSLSTASGLVAMIQKLRDAQM